jgi:hypothetical protein
MLNVLRLSLARQNAMQSRIRTSVFHHCLVPVQAVTNNLESFEDLRNQCRKVAECDVAASEGVRWTFIYDRLSLCSARYQFSQTRIRSFGTYLAHVQLRLVWDLQGMCRSRKQHWHWA